MQQDNSAATYKIWAVDNVVYGPVELPTLVEWVRDERVTAGTWVYNSEGDTWKKASTVPELQIIFRAKGAALSPASTGAAPGARGLQGLKPGSLRRVKIFAEMTDEQLARFVGFMEVQNIRQWNEIVKQGDHGDAMYMILEGELRVRLMIGGKETILTTLGSGEFFGEISLFDSGPRSADVIANKDSILIKITVEAFERLLREEPALAAPFLYAVGKTLTARIRADNKRYKDSVAFSRTATGGAQPGASPR
jgi:hypothetical protein